MTPREISQIEHAARTAFGYDERSYRPLAVTQAALTYAVAAALLVLLVWLVRRT